MCNNLLKQAIEDRGMTITAVSKKTGILRETLYNRMKAGDFRASEIVAISNVLSLSKKEREEIFFPSKVNEIQQKQQENK